MHLTAKTLHRVIGPALLPCAVMAGCGDSESTASGPGGKYQVPDGSASDAKPDTAKDGSTTGEAGSCAAGALECGGACVDPNTDPAHCGACDHACPAGEECKAAACAAAVCDDPCTTEGAKECSGTGVRTCAANATLAGCLEWSAVEPCPSGTTCDPSTATCGKPCGQSCEPFSIVLIPDTQYYTSKQANDAKNTYRKQMQWIADHSQTDNIKYVIHLGDITNANQPEQWDVADTAHAILDKASVPYSVVPGNHDFLSNGVFDRGGSLFDTYFPKSRFAGKSWYGGGYGSGNTNNYGFFAAGQLQFMVISLEYSPRKDVLCWAEDLIASHPGHRVILATHCYLNKDAKYSTGCPDPDYKALGATGADVWRELASRHSNVFMVVSGHIDADEHRVTKGNTGNDVHELVVDYQFEAACSAGSEASCKDHCRAGTYTGNGWMRQMVFDPVNNTVHNETFTVEDGNTSLFPGGKPVFYCSELFNPTDPAADGGNWYSKDPAAADHRFDFAYDMGSAVTHTSDNLGKLAFIDRTANSAAAGDQVAPEVAMTPAGAFVAVWEDDSSDADGAGNHDILARGFAPGGCAGFKDIVVNPNTAGHQGSPRMAMDAQGNFVVVWADDTDDNGVYQIRARGFAPDGSERIAVFTVNSVDAGQQTRPAIAMAPDGAFVVAWEDDGDGDGKAQILVRGFTATGVQSFADRSVHADALGERIRPAVAMDGTGGFVVAWQDDSDANGSYQIHARGFDAVGNERFARITVNSVADGQQRNPVIGAASSGAFVVAWEDDPESNGTYQVLARGLSASGTGVLPDFRVHTAASGTHVAPTLSMEPGGAFVIGWQDDGDANGTYQIHAKSFHADGSAWMAQWQVNGVASGQQLAPSMAMNAKGTLVGIWQDDMDGNGSYQLVARGFDSP